MYRSLCVMLTLGVMLLALSLAGCGGATLQAPPTAPTPTPATQRILMIRSTVTTALPPSVMYDVIGPLAVRKFSYGGAEWALQRLAEEARKAGANAVVEVVITFAPSWGGRRLLMVKALQYGFCPHLLKKWPA